MSVLKHGNLSYRWLPNQHERPWGRRFVANFTELISVASCNPTALLLVPPLLPSHHRPACWEASRVSYLLVLRRRIAHRSEPRQTFSRPSDRGRQRIWL